MSTIDVMLPYYGDVDHMKLAVRSIIDQDDPDWRLVVLDDGYPDDSIPGWFASLGDARVQYQRNETNLGANANYRKCLELVESDWFVMMGADDVALPNYLTQLRKLAADFPEAGILHPGVEVIDENGVLVHGMAERGKDIYRPKVERPTQFSGEMIAANLVRGNWMYFPGICWRASVAKQVGFTTGLDVVQDLKLALDIIETGSGLVLDTTISFQYRRHSASDSSWRALEGTRFLEQGRFFNEQSEHYRQIGWPKAARAARLHLSSRMHAATMIPAAAKAKNWKGVRNLAKHLATSKDH